MLVTARRAEPENHLRLYLTVVVLGAVLFAGVLSIDIPRILTAVRFPSGELNNRWVVTDLATLRRTALAIATLLVASSLILWRHRNRVGELFDTLRSVGRSAARLPISIPLAVASMILLKTVIQLALYAAGYNVYAADDFSRSLSADYWLQHLTFGFGSGGWVGLQDSGWLPFPDYLFGLGLAIHRDIFLTPKFVNLAISTALVVVAYLLGRELFGRLAGLFTAALLAFQPWYVWIGLSGMTSDLPSATLIGMCGVFFVRWLRTGRLRPLLWSAAALAVADGFRYENWLFSVVFSILVLVLAAAKWHRGRLSRDEMAGTVAVLAIANAMPILWMAASRVTLGVWLPELKAVKHYSELAISAGSVTTTKSIAVPLLMMGCFPFEVALSIAGIILFARADHEKWLRPYLILTVATFLLFGTVFNWRVPAWMMIGRYFLGFIMLLAPFAGLLLARLFRAPEPWRQEGALAACVIIVSIGTLDLGRVVNYPAMFPRDALGVGWNLRNLQSIGTIPANGRILIERSTDWGHLGIVAMANGPERFVLLTDGEQPSSERSASHPPGASLNTYSEMCDFAVETCRNRLVADGFRLVILSSEERVAAFEESFRTPSWRIGRYHVFELNAAQRRESR